MSEIILVNRSTESDSDDIMKPGKPIWNYVKDVDGNPQGITLRCTCGKWVHPGNKIAEDGTLIGSFYHHYDEYPNEGCDWHVYLKLRSYP